MRSILLDTCRLSNGQGMPAQMVLHHSQHRSLDMPVLVGFLGLMVLQERRPWAHIALTRHCSTCLIASSGMCDTTSGSVA